MPSASGLTVARVAADRHDRGQLESDRACAQAGAAWRGACQRLWRCSKRGMSIRGVHHLQLAFRAGGAQAMRHFYRDLLGLDELPEAGATLRFSAGGQRIDLVGVAQWQPLSAVSHLAFEVQDLPALRQRLLAAQLPLVENRCRAGLARFYLKDPAGNQLEFLEIQTLALA